MSSLSWTKKIIENIGWKITITNWHHMRMPIAHIFNDFGKQVVQQTAKRTYWPK